MPAKLFYLPFRPAIDPNGLTVSGAQLYFYAAGTLTPLSVYADEALTVELGSTVQANAAGKWPAIFLDEAVLYRAVLKDEDGAVLDDADPYLPSIADELTPELAGVVTDAQTAASNAATSAGTAAAQVPLAAAQVDLAATQAAAAAASAAELANVKQGVGPSAFIFPGLINSSGAYLPSGSWFATDFIEVEGGIDYTVTAWLSAASVYHAWYDAENLLVATFQGPIASSYQTSTHTAPATARYARICTLSTRTDASFKPASGRLSIDQVRDIVEQHPPTLPARVIGYHETNVDAQLTSVTSVLGALSDALAGIANESDRANDVTSPMFVNTQLFTKYYLAPVPMASEVPIVSRDSDTQFTVAGGQGVKLTNSSFPDDGEIVLVVWDGAANRYVSMGILSVVGDVVTVIEPLPPTCTSCMQMHEMANGQHLSRFGYNGLADFIAKQPEKYAYRKEPIFIYNPQTCSTPSISNPDIYDLTETTKLISVKLVGGAGVTSTYVPGTVNLFQRCATTRVNNNLVSGTYANYFLRHYELQDVGAGKGIEIEFPCLFDGFVEIPVAAVRIPHSTNQATTGRVRLEVEGDGTILHDAVYGVGPLNLVRVDLDHPLAVKVRMTFADAVPTSAWLGGILAYRKAPDTPITPIIPDGAHVAAVGDSWTQFPPPVSGEVALPRPDGTVGEGLQFLTERLKVALALQGKTVTTVNWGRGGTTSKHTLYWIDEVINSVPKPSHCVVCCTGINDQNSANAPSSTAYNFDPDNMWLNKPIASGGIDGRVLTAAEWKDNVRAISEKLLEAGIKPIILTPPHTGQIGQSQGLLQNYSSPIVTGLRPS